MADKNNSKPRIELTSYSDKNADGEWDIPPGGFESRKLGCLCLLIRQRHTWDKGENGETIGYYGHAQGILAGGKGYFVSVINEDCPLHGNNTKEEEE